MPVQVIKRRFNLLILPINNLLCKLQQQAGKHVGLYNTVN